MLLFERSCILDSTLGHNIGGWAGHCVHVVAMINVRQVGTRSLQRQRRLVRSTYGEYGDNGDHGSYPGRIERWSLCWRVAEINIRRVTNLAFCLSREWAFRASEQDNGG